MTPKLVQIDIEVQDLTTGAEFYAEFLDLKPSEAEIFGRVVLKVPESSSIGISLVEGSNPDGRIKLYFEVDSLELYLERARLKGVKTSSKIETVVPYGFIAWIEDPFRNRIYLFSKSKSILRRD